MPKKYRIKKLIPGHRLGRRFIGKNLIAVPKLGKNVMVFYGDGIMYIKDWNKCLTKINFKDKFGRGFYTLYYFEWKPEEQLTLI